MINIDLQGNMYTEVIKDFQAEQKIAKRNKRIRNIIVTIILITGFLICARLDNILLVNGLIN